MSDEKDNTSIDFALTATPMSREEERKAKRKAWQAAYQCRPERVVKRRARDSTPEAIAKRKARYQANKEAAKEEARAWYQANKEQGKAARKAWREANRDRDLASKKVHWHANKGRQYGLTPDEFSKMVEACNGRCPCCKTPFSEILGTQPCVDHDHKKGKAREAVRGIVCGRCNLVLGHAADNPAILRACARHLERF
jgi:hypothetical protein